MAPEPMRVLLARALALAALLVLVAGTAHAFRIVNYNVTNYPSVLFPARQPYFRTVLAPLGADVVVVQEMRSQAGVDSFVTNVLNVIEPGQWASAPFFDGNDTDNALFYKPARVQLLGAWAFYPNPANLLRFVTVFRLKPANYTGEAAEFRIYSQHLKASTGSANVAQRYAEAIGIRDSMNAAPPGTAMILCGDFNIYATSENAYKHFLRSLSNNNGQLRDVVNPTPDTTSITWNNGAFAAVHTQCPCLTCPTGSGFSGGGLDDRFDMLLPTGNLIDGEGVDFLPGTTRPVGNDGLHYNLNLTDAPVIPEGAAYATALWSASDHLPVRVDVQLPAKSSGPADLAFGTVIVGATASRTLALANTAGGPTDVIDELNYSLGASAGFTAPAGPRVLAQGQASADPIGMDTSLPGERAGSITVTSDDPDAPTRVIALSGLVLRHAAASLDSAVAVGTGLLDFGTHDAGGFSPLEARVHNLGWDCLQARLSLTTGAIAGGDGRFSIVGAFTPALLSDLGQTYAVAFDDAGATLDSTYEATLTFTSEDEPLPGALPVADLALTLRARVQTSGSVGTPGLAPPTATLLFAPAPNPLVAESRIRFDVAQRGDVLLAAYDLAGRRVATLLDGGLEPGRYSVSWNGRGESGQPLGAGLYFVRMTRAGGASQTVRLAIVR